MAQNKQQDNLKNKPSETKASDKKSEAQQASAPKSGKSETQAKR